MTALPIDLTEYMEGLIAKIKIIEYMIKFIKNCFICCFQRNFFASICASDNFVFLLSFIESPSRGPILFLITQKEQHFINLNIGFIKVKKIIFYIMITETTGNFLLPVVDN